MTRLELMELAEDCSDVLNAMEDDLLNNIAEYLSEGRADIPTAQWKIQQLAALGKLDKANIRTIAEYSDIAADMEEIAMTRAALAAVKEMDEGFAKLARDGIISGTDVPMEESALQAAAMYSKQAKDRLNKVNTVMRYFAKSAAAAAINRTAEIADKQQHLNLLNKAAGKVIMGAESRQSAVRQCIKEMSARGIPAFVDAAGRQWSPEAYINMDVRTTCSNVAHEAQFTRMDDYDIDLLEVSSHAGARPKCALDQGRIFSRSGKNKKYPAWKTSSYGEPDGILGINCGHQIYPYVEGVSVQRYFPYGQEENDELYKKKQEQRRLEREVRGAKREVSMLNAAGDKEGAALAKESVKSKTAAYDKYCEKTGLTRKADRLTAEGYRTKAAEEKKALKGLDNGGGSGIIKYISLPNETLSIDSMTPEVFDAIQSAIENAEKEFGNICSNINITSFGEEHKREPFRFNPIKKGNWYESSLEINKDYNFNPTLSEYEARIMRNYNSGVLASKSLNDLILHEYAHIASFSDCNDWEAFMERENLLRISYVKGISGYADSPPLDGSECLAEAFVRYKNGEPIPEKALDLLKIYIFPYRKKV